MNRKLYLMAGMALALILALTGCMNDTTRGAQTTPTATADYMPGATVAPTATAGTGMTNDNGYGGAGYNGNTGYNGNAGNTANSSSGALTPFDWANNAARIEQAIDRISEIADSRVLVTDTTALVGVKFDNVYKGQLTERIRQMVAAEILKADPSLQTVAVTGEPGDVEKVYQLSDQIRAGRTADELAPEINAIVRNAATMR